MIQVVTIYDDDGQKVHEVASCSCKPLFLWRDVFWGLALALVMAPFIFGG